MRPKGAKPPLSNGFHPDMRYGSQTGPTQPGQTSQILTFALLFISGLALFLSFLFLPEVSPKIQLFLTLLSILCFPTSICCGLFLLKKNADLIGDLSLQHGQIFRLTHHLSQYQASQKRTDVLIEELERKNDLFDQLSRVNDLVNDRHEILNRMIDMAIELMDAESGCLIRFDENPPEPDELMEAESDCPICFDENTSEHALLNFRGREIERLKEFRAEIAKELNERVRKWSAPVRIANDHGTLVLQQKVETYRIGSMVATPLKMRGTVRGVLAVFHKKPQFRIDSKFQSELDRNNISDALRAEFQKRKISLPPNATISSDTGGGRWRITARVDENDVQNYLIILEQHGLNVYTQDFFTETDAKLMAILALHAGLAMQSEAELDHLSQMIHDVPSQMIREAPQSRSIEVVMDILLKNLSSLIPLADGGFFQWEDEPKKWTRVFLDEHRGDTPLPKNLPTTLTPHRLVFIEDEIQVKEISEQLEAEMQADGAEHSFLAFPVVTANEWEGIIVLCRDKVRHIFRMGFKLSEEARKRLVEDLIKDLDRGQISLHLQDQFEVYHNISLSSLGTISVEVKGSRWMISDQSQSFTVRQEDGQLDVYAGQPFSDSDRKLFASMMAHALGLYQRSIGIVHGARFAHLGRIAVNLIHSAKNLLNPIIPRAQIIGERDNEPELREKSIEVIKERVNRVSQMLETIQDFVKLGPLVYVPIQVTPILDEVLELLELEIDKYSIHLERNYAKSLPEIRGDGSALKKVFFNIIINAIQVMPDGGRLDIKADTIQGAGYLQILISDTGPGIKPSDREKIFELLYSTRRDGTGLGLPLAYEDIESHNGRLYVHPEVNHGTTMVVELPLACKSKGDFNNAESLDC
jgi:signal transduction histidine kinase/GAF domain-containing protein